MIKSPYKKDASQLRVSALAFDGPGAIIGGGYTYLDFVPAEGQAAAEVSVVTSGQPAKSRTVCVFEWFHWSSSKTTGASSSPTEERVVLWPRCFGPGHRTPAEMR